MDEKHYRVGRDDVLLRNDSSGVLSSGSSSGKNKVNESNRTQRPKRKNFPPAQLENPRKSVSTQAAARVLTSFSSHPFAEARNVVNFSTSGVCSRFNQV